MFPTYSEGKDAVWRDPKMLFNIIPPEVIAKVNESELVVYFKNGSILQLKGADNPERLKGSGPIGVVLDEFGTMKYETWSEVVEPIIRANYGWCWFVGTPKGKNHLFEIYQRGNLGHNEWQSFMMRADKSGVIADDQLANAKMSMSQTLYNQEMLCEFLEGEGSVFRNVRDAATAKPQAPMRDHLYVMGVDLAKVQDYTVITVYDRTTNAQVFQDRFNKLEWPFQKKKIYEICRFFNNALLYIDGTGLGDPVVDDLVRMGLPIEPIKLTSESKKELIEKLSIYIEQKKVRLLPLDQTFFEFDNFSYVMTVNGRVRYQAREGFHDDIVISHALAVWGLQPIITQVPDAQLTQMQLAYRARLKQQYGQSDDEGFIDLQELD